MPVVSHDYIDKHRQIIAALVRAQTILENMAVENVNPWRRWPIHHESLRADAKALLPVIRAALGDHCASTGKMVEAQEACDE